MNRRIFTAALSVLLLSGVSAFAQGTAWTLDTNHSQIIFSIRNLTLSTVHGSIGGVTGTVVWDEKNPGKSSVEATMDAKRVSTNNDSRDDHLKSPDFFNVDKYPTLTFKSTAVTSTNGKIQVVGDLTLVGVTRSVTLNADGPTSPQKGVDGKMVMGFSATGKLKRSDFNFGSKYGSAILGDDVRFTINVEASR